MFLSERRVCVFPLQNGFRQEEKEIKSFHFVLYHNFNRVRFGQLAKKAEGGMRGCYDVLCAFSQEISDSVLLSFGTTRLLSYLKRLS